MDGKEVADGVGHRAASGAGPQDGQKLAGEFGMAAVPGRCKSTGAR